MTGQAIVARLKRYFPDAEIEFIDDSEKHAGHREYKALGVSHARVSIICERFAGLSMVKRHQMIYSCFKEEMASDELHSLVIEQALTPEECPQSLKN